MAVGKSSFTHVPNRAFRRLLLALNGLAVPIAGDGLSDCNGRRGGAWVDAMVRRLGFVQIDPIAVVARAHDQILFARSRAYRPALLRSRIERERTLFEGWTHDAAVLPSEVFPYWRHYVDRFKRYEVHAGYKRYFTPVTEQSIAQTRKHVDVHGATRARDIKSTKVNRGANLPAPTVAKITLEYLWRIGELAITRREGQEKVYDLAARVLPQDAFDARVSKAAYVDWACRESLRRLGAATPSQIAHFFDAVSTADAASWCEQQRDLLRVRVELANRSKSVPLYMLPETREHLNAAPTPPSGLRLLSPFDPLVRDRKRAARVFGFDYTVEIFVPPTQRVYGYYVLPILEGDRFTGRIDLKIDRKEKQLNVIGLWWEPGVKPTPRRIERLQRRLEQQARFANVIMHGLTPQRSHSQM